MPGLANFIIDHINRGIAGDVASDPSLSPADMGNSYTQQTGLPAGDLFAGAQQSALAKLASNPDFMAKPYQDQLVDLAKIDPVNAVSNLQALTRNKAMWSAYTGNGSSSPPQSPQMPPQYGNAVSTPTGDGSPALPVPQGYGQSPQASPYPALAGLAQVGAQTGLFSPADAVGMAAKQTEMAKQQADTLAAQSQVPKNQAEAALAQAGTREKLYNTGAVMPSVPLPITGQPPAMRGLPQVGGAPAIPQVSASDLQPPLSGAQINSDGTPTQPSNHVALASGASPQSPSPAPVAPHLLASDGKPFIPDVASNFWPPDPSGLPHVNVTPQENSKLGMAEAEKNMGARIDVINKGNEAFTSSLSSLQNEQYRLKELADIYHQTQAGTATAQNVDLVNKAIGLGLIKSPDEIKDVGNLQSATGNAIMQIINQVKDTNNNMGAAPARLFGSEINEMLEKGGDNIGSQPQALNRLVGEALGFVNHHIDMVNGWTAIGGPGNRMQNGTTMLPDDYSQKFMETHDLGDYEKLAHQQIGTFKGMPANAAPTSGQPITKSYMRGADGKLVAQ